MAAREARAVNEELNSQLKFLRLPELLENWDSIIMEADKKSPSYTRFLKDVIAKEYAVKKERARCLRIKRAKIPEVYVMETGLTATVGQLLLTSGFKYTTTMLGLVCSLQTTVLNLILGFLFLGELPPATFFLGFVFVCTGLAGLLRRERGLVAHMPG